MTHENEDWSSRNLEHNPRAEEEAFHDTTGRQRLWPVVADTEPATLREGQLPVYSVTVCVAAKDEPRRMVEMVFEPFTVRVRARSAADAADRIERALRALHP